MIDVLARRLPDVKAPALVIHGTGDKVVDPKSAEIIMDGLGSEKKTLQLVDSKRHGILNENIGDCQETVISFLGSLSISKQSADMS